MYKRIRDMYRYLKKEGPKSKKATLSCSQKSDLVTYLMSTNCFLGKKIFSINLKYTVFPYCIIFQKITSEFISTSRVWPSRSKGEEKLRINKRDCSSTTDDPDNTPIPKRFFI